MEMESAQDAERRGLPTSDGEQYKIESQARREEQQLESLNGEEFSRSKRQQKRSELALAKHTKVKKQEQQHGIVTNAPFIE